MLAFADGELTPEECQAVIEAMAEDTAVAKQVLHQQQLRGAIARCAGTGGLHTPAALRAKVAALGEQVGAARDNITDGA
ncbi:MAG: hypothetical protein MI741_12640, partial [Rhodospirillales bacterium]|nr:hypothetical protein [Rhodospirillales bacterium]